MNTPRYYVPAQSPWPILGALALGGIAIGTALSLQSSASGHYFLGAGTVALTVMLVGWFRDVIFESRGNYYSPQVDRSFRMGMYWFIFSELMFFAAFFGALFYIRWHVVPILGGLSVEHLSTHLEIWPTFKSAWPLLENPNPKRFVGPTSVIEATGLPAWNTLILLTSSITLYQAERGLLENRRTALIGFLALTLVLAWIFLGLQAYEYLHAWHLGLTLRSGIYGTTFFALTGFHGLHVFLGSLMIGVMLLRCLKGHFSPTQHFGLAAVAWYWHFVDVIWLLLFVFVYWF